MPELPEVEIVCRSLKPHLINRKIDDLSIITEKLRYPVPAEVNDIINDEIINVERRAKYILISTKKNFYLIFHLGMTGKLLLQNNNYDLVKHDHFILHLSDGFILVFNDARRFGFVGLSKNIEEYFKDSGIEPLSEKFNADYLLYKFKNITSPIKTAIMNNNIIVGVGNIYASESLFKAGINPHKKACSLKYEELEKLVICIQEVLTLAINAGGSSFKDFVNINGSSGNFQNDFSVYNKENHNCYICSEKILKIKQSGRSSYYCPKCQI